MSFGLLSSCLTAWGGGFLQRERAQRKCGLLKGPRVKGEAVADFKPEAGQRAEKRGSTGRFVPRLLQSTLPPNGAQTLKC